MDLVFHSYELVGKVQVLRELQDDRVTALLKRWERVEVVVKLSFTDRCKNSAKKHCRGTISTGAAKDQARNGETP